MTYKFSLREECGARAGHRKHNGELNGYEYYQA